MIDARTTETQRGGPGPSSVGRAFASTLFQDGFGDRTLDHESRGARVEVLRLDQELGADGRLEADLLQRLATFEVFRHPQWARCRRVFRREGRLMIVSDSTAGFRLSQVLPVSDRGLRLEAETALALVREVVHVVAALHAHDPRAAHGALGPERLVMTPEGRLTIVEALLGGVVAIQPMARDALWRDLRVATPATGARVGPRADMTAVGMVALALLLGRRIRTEEYPFGLAGLVSSASARLPGGGTDPLWGAFRLWLVRALQLNPFHSFESATEAEAALEAVVQEAPGCQVDRAALETAVRAWTATSNGLQGAGGVGR